jgi:Ala-tRNA(Pro) deacylase
VTVVQVLAALLRRERVPHTTFRHAPAYTAQEVAAISHVPGRCWAKVVICIADDQPVQATIPAHHTVDLDQLRLLVGAATLRLARETEIAELYPDCEVGAVPPFGRLYGHRLFIDRCLVGEPEVVFSAGTHTDAFRMHYWDLAEIARPVVGTFGIGPARRPRTLRFRPRREKISDAARPE